MQSAIWQDHVDMLNTKPAACQRLSCWLCPSTHELHVKRFSLYASKCMYRHAGWHTNVKRNARGKRHHNKLNEQLVFQRHRVRAHIVCIHPNSPKPSGDLVFRNSAAIVLAIHELRGMEASMCAIVRRFKHLHFLAKHAELQLDLPNPTITYKVICGRRTTS